MLVLIGLIFGRLFQLRISVHFTRRDRHQIHTVRPLERLVDLHTLVEFPETGVLLLNSIQSFTYSGLKVIGSGHPTAGNAIAVSFSLQFDEAFAFHPLQ